MLKVTEGAEISINGKAVGKSPLPGPVFVEPGAATIEAKIGDKSAKKTIAMDVGEARELEIVIAARRRWGRRRGREAGMAARARGGRRGERDRHVKPPAGSRSTIGMIASGAVAVVGLGVGVGL
jgi:hypothetical protein